MQAGKDIETLARTTTPTVIPEGVMSDGGSGFVTNTISLPYFNYAICEVISKCAIFLVIEISIIVVSQIFPAKAIILMHFIDALSFCLTIFYCFGPVVYPVQNPCLDLAWSSNDCVFGCI